MQTSALLAEEVEAYIDLVDRFFPDVFFASSESGRPLTVRLSPGKARYIRLTNKGQPLLHLGSFYAESTIGEAVTERATLETSSTHRSMEGVPLSETFFRRGYSQLGLHTASEPAPWAIVDLGSVYELAFLEISNWEPWSHRSWGLCVDVSEDHESWANVYDHTRAVDLLKTLITHRCLTSRTELPKAMLNFIGDLFYHVVSRDPNEACKKLRRANFLNQDEKRAITAVFNRRCLYPRSLEWTTHGFSRTFRFWSDDEKCRYLKFTQEVVSALKTLTPHVSMGFGSVLGLVRDHNFIPHDDDMDIIIAFPHKNVKSYSDAFHLISTQLSNSGYEVFGDYFSHKHVRKKGERTLDVFVGFVEDQFVSWYPSARKNLIVEDIFPTILIDALGVKCDIPRNPFNYLRATYGPDWVKPISNWHHPWNEKAFAEFVA